jgi:AcrR family transcriptional regulator
MPSAKAASAKSGSPGSAKAESAKAHQAAQTRDAIVGVCLRLFAERGFAATSVDEIARSAGITKGAIYWHFANKDALFTGILTLIRDVWTLTILRPLATAHTPRARLETLFDNYERLYTEDPHVCLFLHRVLLEADEKFAPQVDKVFEQSASTIAGVIEEGRQSGDFRQDVDGAALARLIVSSLTGAHIQAKYSKGVRMHLLLGELREAVLLHATVRRLGSA